MSLVCEWTILYCCISSSIKWLIRENKLDNSWNYEACGWIHTRRLERLVTSRCFHNCYHKQRYWEYTTLHCLPYDLLAHHPPHLYSVDDYAKTPSLTVRLALPTQSTSQTNHNSQTMLNESVKLHVLETKNSDSSINEKEREMRNDI